MVDVLSLSWHSVLLTLCQKNPPPQTPSWPNLPASFVKQNAAPLSGQARYFQTN